MFHVLLGLDTHCSALTPRDKECTGDTQIAQPPGWVSSWLGALMVVNHRTPTERQLGCWCGGQGMWGLPSTHRTTQAQHHSRGAAMELGDRVYPATVRAGGSRAATPTGPPTTYFWAAGSWAGSQGAGRAGGAAALGSAKATRPRSQSGERKPAGKKQNSPRRKPKLTSQPDVSPVLWGHEPLAEPGALWGSRRAGRMQPSGRGWDTARTRIQGWGQPVLASCCWDKGAEGSCGLEHHNLNLGSGERQLPCASSPLWVCCQCASVSPGGPGQGVPCSLVQP